MKKWTATRNKHSQSVIDVSVCVDTPEWRQDWLIASDVHYDHPHCLREKLHKTFTEAKERGAGIVIPGDFYCVMQGKYDRRHAKGNVRPEHLVNDYFNEVVKDATDFLAEFAENLVVLADGNHETAILKNHEIDLIGMTCERLQEKYHSPVIRGHYGGWMRHLFQRCNERASRVWRYFHGAGGGGEVTRGTIQSNRQAAYLDGVDVVINGHTHDQWSLVVQQVGLGQSGKVRQREQLHIRAASWKDEYREGASGWHVERWGPPKPTGGFWLTYTWDRDHGPVCREQRTY